MSLKGGPKFCHSFTKLFVGFITQPHWATPVSLRPSAVEMQVHLFVFGGQERGGRRGVDQSPQRRTHCRRPAHFTRAKTLPNWSGGKEGSPIKKCSRKRAAHCHWVHFVSLSWHRNSSCGEAAAYPQAMHAMWHFGCKAVRPLPSVGVIGQGGLLRKCQMSGANTRSPY